MSAASIVPGGTTGTEGTGLARNVGASLTAKQLWACCLIEGAVAAVARTGAGRKLVSSATYAAVAAALAGGEGLAEFSDGDDDDMPLRVEQVADGLQMHRGNLPQEGS